MFNAIVLSGVVLVAATQDATATEPTPSASDNALTFSPSDFVSYKNQDRTVTTFDVVNNNEVHAAGNTWKAVDLSHVVTDDSYVQLEYKTVEQAEIQGLMFLYDGLEPADAIHHIPSIIRMDGSQDYSGALDPLYMEANGEWQTITVKLSDYYEIGASLDHLVFINDSDKDATGGSEYKNIFVFKAIAGPTPPASDNALTFSPSDFVSYKNQDRTVTTFDVANNNELHIGGNIWKAVDHSHVVTDDSYVQLEYKTVEQAEIQGLMFLYDGLEPADAIHHIPSIIRMDGSQDYSGALDPLYTEANGEWQTITVKLSDYYEIGASLDHLVFVNDSDKDATGESQYKNIHVFEYVNSPDIGVQLDCSKDVQTYVGGEGDDTINCSNLDVTVEIDLESGNGAFGKEAGYIFTNLENIIGTDLAFMQGDILYGNAEDNDIAAGRGPDVIRPRAGVDYIDGGDGFDLVEYTDSSEAVIIDVNYLSYYGLPMGQGGDAQGDEYRFIEAFGGSNFNDIFIGDDSVNIFNGHGGNDTYDLGAGRDQVTDDGGDDTYIYTSGADIYHDTGGQDTVIFKSNLSPDDAYIYQNIVTFDNDNYVTFNDINQIENFQFTALDGGSDTTLTLQQFKELAAGVGDENPQPDPDNNNPVLGADSFKVDEDTLTELDILFNDTDPENDYLTITSCTSPMEGASLTWPVTEGNTLWYNPKAEYNGSDHFDCTVTDDRGGQATQRVNITVVPDINEVETYLYLVMSASNDAGYGGRSDPAEGQFDDPYITISFDRPTRLENGKCIEDGPEAVAEYKIEFGVEQGVYEYMDVISAESVHVNCTLTGLYDEQCGVEIERCTEEDFYIEGYYQNFEQ
ncbi:MAG: hypothetical protein COB14_00900 [Alphaproteobacteria bacterium]|nr:MAG: hypothetical protein COB14_00900 [Alphaproteobacteria bacterium]